MGRTLIGECFPTAAGVEGQGRIVLGEMSLHAGPTKMELRANLVLRTVVSGGERALGTPHGSVIGCKLL